MPDSLLLDRLLKVTDQLTRDMARAFADTELTPARMGVMWVVHHDGPSTQKAIARHLDVSARNVTGLVDALERSGYLVRTAHPADRRAHLVTLTPIGTELMTTAAHEHAALSASLRAAVAPADRAPLERGLDAVTTRLAELIALEAKGAS